MMVAQDRHEREAHSISDLFLLNSLNDESFIRAERSITIEHFHAPLPCLSGILNQVSCSLGLSVVRGKGSARSSSGVC